MFGVNPLPLTIATLSIRSCQQHLRRTTRIFDDNREGHNRAQRLPFSVAEIRPKRFDSPFAPCTAMLMIGSASGLQSAGVFPVHVSLPSAVSEGPLRTGSIPAVKSRRYKRVTLIYRQSRSRNIIGKYRSLVRLLAAPLFEDQPRCSRSVHFDPKHIAVPSSFPAKSICPP